MGQTAHPLTEPERLEHDVERIREGLTEVVSELDRRRHDLMNWRLQFARHSGLLAVVGGALVVLVGGIVGVKVWRARHRPPPPLFARKVLPPRQESIGHKVVAAGAAALVGVTAKTVAQRAIGWADHAQWRAAGSP